MKSRQFIKEILRVLIYLVVINLIASCTSDMKNDLLMLPSSTVSTMALPTQTATISPTSTPIPLILSDRMLPTNGEDLEPYPDLEVITTENVHLIEEVDRWGQGTVMGIALSPDGSTIAVSTATGIYFYDANSMVQTDWIDFFVDGTDCAFANCAYSYTYDNLDYSPDGKTLLIGFTDLYTLDMETKKPSRFETAETDMERSYITETTYSEDGKYILLTRALTEHGIDMQFEIYDTGSARRVFHYDFKLFDSNARINLIDDNYVAVHQILVDVTNGNIIQEKAQSISDAIDQTIVYESFLDDQWRVTLPQKNLTCDFFGNYEQAFLGSMNDFSEDHLTLVTLGDSILNIWHFDPCQKSEQLLTFPEAF